MASAALSAPLLWDHILAGPRSDAFWALHDARVDAAVVGTMGPLRPALGDEAYAWLRAEAPRRFRQALTEEIGVLYGLTETELALEATMVAEMKRLTPAEFERVLHPVFEEDEWTLILVGTALGGLSGFAQAAVG